ncbi:MAG: hypothetical protein K9K64_02550 [Desulfohalobiaceae bacterium]|nr:hypothetical protein [Desulfohalobiaceae bacterium]
MILQLVQKHDLNPTWFFTGEGEMLLSEQNRKVMEGAAAYETERAREEREYKERLQSQFSLADFMCSQLRQVNAPEETIQQVLYNIAADPNQQFPQPSRISESKAEYNREGEKRRKKNGNSSG